MKGVMEVGFKGRRIRRGGGYERYVDRGLRYRRGSCTVKSFPDCQFWLLVATMMRGCGVRRWRRHKGGSGECRRGVRDVGVRIEGGVIRSKVLRGG